MRPSESQLNQITKAWPSVKDMLSVPHSKAQYGRMVRFLDSLIDEVGNDQAHPLAALMETVGRLIEVYEELNVPAHSGDSVSALKMLMDEHGFKQKDMKEIGSQGVVSEILNGKRQLNRRQVQALAEKFHVSPAVFL
jgi:HTH-type transcriptional regulator/antitoxin HigA